MELIGLLRVYARFCYFKEVNDTYDFEVSKLGGIIVWEKFFK
tara:strand:- start:41 stop:166 length:126 start_codon:yes stop_codon:yes gene_type:complete